MYRAKSEVNMKLDFLIIVTLLVFVPIKTDFEWYEIKTKSINLYGTGKYNLSVKHFVC